MTDSELVRRIAESTGLSEAEAARVIGDVLAHHGETVEQLVRRRHSELALRGLHNPEIFPIIEAELTERRVAPPPLTQRQLRRIVYG
ncbi:MAG: hypothetical protein JWP82_2107 [Humibacillus sp.]|nr:hypothetical protein [Humibacillus sp.]